MKTIRINVLLIILLVINSCGGKEKDDPTPPPVVNNVPSIPNLVGPEDKLLCIDNNVTFSWNSSVDPDGDPIIYELNYAKNSSMTQDVSTIKTASLNYTVILEKGVAYYWRVKAIDNKNKASDFSNQRSFYTEGIAITNYAPFAATLVKPVSTQTEPISTSTSVTLEWNATDLNTSDILTYDVYLSIIPTFGSPVSVNQSTKTYSQSDLTSNTIYYWRIDVKDNKGLKTIGQVWTFKTK